MHIQKIFQDFKRFLVALTLASPSLLPCCCLLSVSTAARAGSRIWLKHGDFASLVGTLLPGDRGAFQQPVCWAGSSWSKCWLRGNIWNPVALQKLSTNQRFRKAFLSLWFIAWEAFHVHILILGTPPVWRIFNVWFFGSGFCYWNPIYVPEYFFWCGPV